MAYFKWILVALLGPMVIEFPGLAMAEEGVPPPPLPGQLVIEMLVTPNFVEVICPEGQCIAICPELGSLDLLAQNACYRIGPNCTLEPSDCSALFDAQEHRASLLGGPIEPGGGLPFQDGLDPSFLVPTEANQNLVVPTVSIVVPTLPSTPAP